MTTAIQAERLTASLDDPAAQDPDATGHKAANLARLAAAGFPVPRGVVLTRTTCERVVAEVGIGPRDGAGGAATGAFPADVSDALSAILDDLGAGGQALAVRSSGISEDLPGASFAGQYETVLGVKDRDGLAAAVRTTLESAFSARVVTYAHRMDGRAPMAVLIQQMITPDAAGVAFTANPVTGDRETLVNAVRGLGDRLVGGEATPDDWVVRDGIAQQRSGSEDAIDAALATRIAALAERVEAIAGAPQDIEWAVAGGEVHLLQARPITALPRKPELDIPTEGIWSKDDGHYAMPLTPFGASVYLPAMGDSLGSMAEEFGLLVQGAEQRSLGGEVYIRVIPLGGKEGGKAPPWWVLWLAARLAPELRRRARIADEALRSGLADRLIDRWNQEWRPAFRAEAAALRARTLGAMSDDELQAHLDELVDLMGRGQQVHFRLFAPFVLTMYDLATACQELLGWGPLDAMSLVAGTSEVSSAPGRELESLATMVSARPQARAVLDGDVTALLPRMREIEPEVADALEAYLDEHGHRTLSYDPADPTLAERPDLLVRLLRDRLATSGADAERAQGATGRAAALDRARTGLTHKSAADRERFERALAAAERAYPTREETIVYSDNLPAGLVRYAMLEFGRRLAGRGVIAAAEDAAFLDVEELRMALRGGVSDMHGVVARRRAERAWVVAHPGPASYGPGPAGPPPDLRGLPPALRYVMSALMWTMDIMLTPTGAGDDGRHVLGVPGSPGRHTGTARVIRSESEFGRLRPGDVLVCPTTTPSWSVLFGQAGAVVTDGGGVLAHAALIAREYGIPAVLATGDATRRISDGQLVTVDGTAGKVTPL